MALDNPKCDNPAAANAGEGRPAGNSIEGRSQSVADGPNDNAFRTLVRTYGLLGRAMQPFFMRFGITVSQFAVLRTLRCAESEAIRKGEVPTDANGKGHRLEATALPRR